MKKYIFITSEGFTFQPGSESTAPDIENLQVVGFAEGNSPEEAIKSLLMTSPHIAETSFDEVTALELKSENGPSYSLKDLLAANAR